MLPLGPHFWLLTTPALQALLLDTVHARTGLEKRTERVVFRAKARAHRPRPIEINQQSSISSFSVFLHPLRMASPAERVAEALVPERAEHEVRVEKRKEKEKKREENS